MHSEIGLVGVRPSCTRSNSPSLFQRTRMEMGCVHLSVTRTPSNSGLVQHAAESHASTNVVDTGDTNQGAGTDAGFCGEELGHRGHPAKNPRNHASCSTREPLRAVHALQKCRVHGHQTRRATRRANVSACGKCMYVGHAKQCVDGGRVPERCVA